MAGEHRNPYELIGRYQRLRTEGIEDHSFYPVKPGDQFCATTSDSRIAAVKLVSGERYEFGSPATLKVTVWDT